ncbi:hypothetical protein LY78DRAFT_662905 [Colletotrichum sublineola]|nr:hypothetical protein LY78DRAFT_662905 [Colletotrichum sublineola]
MANCVPSYRRLRLVGFLALCESTGLRIDDGCVPAAESFRAAVQMWRSRRRPRLEMQFLKSDQAVGSVAAVGNLEAVHSRSVAAAPTHIRFSVGRKSSPCVGH